jgi:hypothetical protein
MLLLNHSPPCILPTGVISVKAKTEDQLEDEMSKLEEQRAIRRKRTQRKHIGGGGGGGGGGRGSWGVVSDATAKHRLVAPWMASMLKGDDGTASPRSSSEPLPLHSRQKESTARSTEHQQPTGFQSMHTLIRQRSGLDVKELQQELDQHTAKCTGTTRYQQIRTTFMIGVSSAVGCRWERLKRRVALISKPHPATHHARLRLPTVPVQVASKNKNAPVFAS